MVTGRARATLSMFRQYQLIYIIGEERDVAGLRGAIWKTPVHLYPARTSVERQRSQRLRQALAR